MREDYAVPELIEFAPLVNITTASSIPSDQSIKTGFAEVQGREVLQRLATMPISTWRYKKESPDVRHIGPMAQDFKAAFGVGGDDKSIAFVDANGVTMAAIQGLYQRLQDKDAEIAELHRELAVLEERLHKLEK